MRQSKLLDLLRRFSSRQLTRFRDFLGSPYFNRSEPLIRFFEHLLLYAPDFQNEGLQKAAVLQQFQPGETLTEKRLTYLASQLQQQAESFLAVESLRADDLEASLALLQFFDPDQLPRHYRSALDTAQRTLRDTPLRNAEYYLRAFRLSEIRYRQEDRNQHRYSELLQHSSDALDEFYLVEKLRYCWAMANLEYMLNLHFEWNMGEWLLDYLASGDRLLNPTAQIYHTGILMVRDADDTTHFFRLRGLLAEYENRFSESERKYLYTGLLNYCTRRINRQNDPQFSEEYLEINKNLLANGLLFENGLLSPWRFLNLVNTGLRNGQTDWVQAFIRQYRERLPQDYTEDISLIAQAQYHFHHKEFGPAQILLNQANPRDVLLAVTVRNLLARIYYESGETELLLSFLEAYRVYLLRQDLLSAQMKQQARRFVDFTRKLAKIDRPEAQQLPKLLADLPPAPEIYHRDWLEAQIRRRMAEWRVG